VISSENVPISRESSDGDFTLDSYRELLVLAKKSYTFASYSDIPWGQRFLLWRHDCDFSLNRAFALARIEADLGICATYFLNPHCAFYNLLEHSQYHLVNKIVGMGHQIGLHFDAAFFDTSNVEDLSTQVHDEADFLERVFGMRPSAFSFHNPLAIHLKCEEETYGGLINCYSRRFKAEVPYCSDSNGYWRFRRLRDVLERATDPCLQVLTHPGWWQDNGMPPRQRVFRSAYGRARATMADYDTVITSHGRENLSGPASALTFLRGALPERHALLDFLWMSGEMATLFIELWRLHENQIHRLCKAVLRKEWQVPAREVNAFFDTPSLAIDCWRLFPGLFGQSRQEILGAGADAYPQWDRLRHQLVHSLDIAPTQQLEEGCVFLCGVIAALATWGGAQPNGYDGLAHLDIVGLLTCKTADGCLTERLEEVADEFAGLPCKRWEQLKVAVANVCAARASE
jgi:hypothetical protein